MSAPAVGWDASLYAANTAHHRQFDEAVLAGLPVEPDSRILDLGCGVGDFTARLARLAPRGAVLGVDADPGMVAAARQGSGVGQGNVRFEVCRAQDVGTVVAPGEQDLVISVAMLQWIPAAEHPQVLSGVHRALRPGGWFRAECGGHGQLAELRAVVDAEAVRYGGQPAQWFFPTTDEYAALLSAAGFSVRSPGWLRMLRQQRPFPDVTAFLGFLRSQILVAYDATVAAGARAEFRAAAEDRAIAELVGTDSRYDQEYVRLDFLAARG